MEPSEELKIVLNALYQIASIIDKHGGCTIIIKPPRAKKQRNAATEAKQGAEQPQHGQLAIALINELLDWQDNKVLTNASFEDIALDIAKRWRSATAT